MKLAANSVLIAARGSPAASETAEPMVLRLEDCQSLKLPPGLELFEEHVEHWLARFPTNRSHLVCLEPGMPAKIFADASDGAASDDTSVGSAAECESSQSGSTTSDSMEHQRFSLNLSQLLGNAPRRNNMSVDTYKSDDSYEELSSPGRLVLSEVSKLKASSPNFVSAVSPVATPLQMSGTTQKTLARTKLRAKADLFIPSRDVSTSALALLPFVPMAAVNQAWQNWSDATSPESITGSAHAAYEP